jgi:hypothetical protein
MDDVMAAKQAKGGKLLLPALLISSLLGAMILQMGFIFLLIAILPSVVAYFIDETQTNSVFRVVLMCNLSGTLPYLAPMLGAATRGERHDSYNIIMDPTTWLVIYCAAAAGWSLIFLCRYIGRFLAILYFEYRIGVLERFQKKLVAEWGNKITETEKLDENDTDDK